MFFSIFSDLSERLNLSKEEGEKWIVNLIRETRMGSDAKIDLEKVRFHFRFRSLSLSVCSPKFPIPQNVIEINRPAQPVYQTIIEKSAQATYAPSQQQQQQQKAQQSAAGGGAKVDTASQASQVPAVAVN
jgi:translation initiation factor 3 subunit E